MTLALIIILLLVGLLLLIAEAFIPGGIVSAIGIIFLLVSGILFAREYGWTAGWIYFCVATVAGFAFWLWGFLFIARKLALLPPKNSAPDETPPPGASGTVVQTLRPIGCVEIGGKRYAAQSAETSREIPPGTAVTVTGVDSAYLIVEAIP